MRLRTAAATVFATAILLCGAASTASAQEHDLVFDAGVACAFPLGLDGGEFPPERKTFTDPNGNPIVLLAGKSGAVTYTNLVTEGSLTFPSRGTALRVTTGLMRRCSWSSRVTLASSSSRPMSRRDRQPPKLMAAWCSHLIR